MHLKSCPFTHIPACTVAVGVRQQSCSFRGTLLWLPAASVPSLLASKQQQIKPAIQPDSKTALHGTFFPCHRNDIPFLLRPRDVQEQRWQIVQARSRLPWTSARSTGAFVRLYHLVASHLKPPGDCE